MSFHQYYTSLSSSILHEIFFELSKLKKQITDGTNNNNSGDNTTITNNFEQLQKRYDKLELQIKNHPYHFHYFVLDFNIQESDRLSLDIVYEQLYGLSYELISIPFIDYKLKDVLIDKIWNFYYKGSQSYSDDENEKAMTQINNFFKHYGSLILCNLCPDATETTYDIFDHIITFWIFNNIDLTKTHNLVNISENVNKFTQYLKDIVDISDLFYISSSMECRYILETLVIEFAKDNNHDISLISSRLGAIYAYFSDTYFIDHPADMR
jgi:hypothetical protein